MPNKTKKPKLIHASIAFIVLIFFMLLGIVYFGTDPHTPMFIGVIIAAVIALVLGFKYENLEKMMVDGISKSMQSILILIVVGMLIGI